MSDNHLLLTWLDTWLNVAAGCILFAEPTSLIVVHATLDFIEYIFQFPVLYVAQPSCLNTFNNLVFRFHEDLVLASNKLICFIGDMDADVHLVIYRHVIMNFFAVVKVLVELFYLLNINLVWDRILIIKHFL